MLQAASASNVAPSSKTTREVQSWADKLKEGYADLKAQGVVALPTIVYSSRTHSQLAQVMKELRNTSYRLATCSHPQKAMYFKSMVLSQA